MTASLDDIDALHTLCKLTFLFYVQKTGLFQQKKISDQRFSVNMA